MGTATGRPITRPNVAGTSATAAPLLVWIGPGCMQHVVNIPFRATVRVPSMIVLIDSAIRSIRSLVMDRPGLYDDASPYSAMVPSVRIDNDRRR